MDGLGIILVILVVIWLIIREFNCWYWKINERNRKLDEITRYLKILVEQQEERRESFEVEDDESDMSLRVESDMRIEYSDGSVYIGDVVNDTPNGRGIWINHKNETLESMFVNGEPYGKGTLTDSEGNTYKVEYIDGEMVSKERI